MVADPIIDAKTVKEFLEAINVPTDVSGAPVLENLLAIKITVVKKTETGYTLYCGQADTPSTEFGLAAEVQGTVILKYADKEVKIVMSKCKED